MSNYTTETKCSNDNCDGMIVAYDRGKDGYEYGYAYSCSKCGEPPKDIIVFGLSNFGFGVCGWCKREIEYGDYSLQIQVPFKEGTFSMCRRCYIAVFKSLSKDLNANSDRTGFRENH